MDNCNVVWKGILWQSAFKDNKIIDEIGKKNTKKTDNFFLHEIKMNCHICVDEVSFESLQRALNAQIYYWWIGEKMGGNESKQYQEV